MRLVEEEHQLRLRDVADLRQLLESSARSHISTVEKSFGLSCTAGSSRQEMIPRPSGAVRSRSAISNCGSPKNSVPPPSSSWTSDRSSTPIVADETPPMPLRSCLPSFESKKVRSALKSARSEERRVGKECRSRWSPYHSKKKT